MRFFTFFIFVIVSLLAYKLGRRDGAVEYQQTNDRIQEIMSDVDISQFKDETEIQQYIADQLGMKPEEIFVEKVVIDLDENDE